MLDCLRLVHLDGDGNRHIAHHLLQDCGAHNHLLALLQKDAEVGSEVGLAFAAVDYDHLALGAGRRHQFHVRGEGCTAKADHAGKADFLDNSLVIGRNIGYQSI